MIRESAEFRHSCFWFSANISKQTNLRNITPRYATEVKTIPMAQGNKVSRIVAWTFLDRNGLVQRKLEVKTIVNRTDWLPQMVLATSGISRTIVRATRRRAGHFSTKNSGTNNLEFSDMTAADDDFYEKWPPISASSDESNQIIKRRVYRLFRFRFIDEGVFFIRSAYKKSRSFISTPISAAKVISRRP